MLLVATNAVAERPPTGMLTACAKRKRENIKPKDEWKIEKLAENERKRREINPQRSKETRHKERQAGAELGRLNSNWN